MKQIYILTIALFLVPLFSNAQQDPAQISTLLYHNNFTNGFGGMYSSDGRSLSRATSGGNTSSYLASGGAYGYTVPNNTSVGRYVDKFILLDNISTVGFKNVKIIWANRQNYNVSSSFPKARLFYSVDGSAFEEVSGWQANSTMNNSWNLVNNGQYVSLPADAMNADRLTFAWFVRVPTSDSNDYYYALDDVTIVGTPEEDPTTAENDLSVFDWSSLPNGTNPFSTDASYEVDGNVLKWSRASSSGVTVTEAAVGTTFQAPTKTLSVLQRGASSSTGTRLRVDFAEPVADLTFSLFDVDQSSGQFQDNIKITGVGYSGRVVLAETKVITTFNNSFSTATNAITGVSGSDVNSATPGGNVKISFSEPVGQVNIEYYNLDAAKGNQGIGVHNLSWRRDRSLAPLPVELVSFKGAAVNGAAKLTWATAQEKNNERFVVERSQDGKAFAAIGEVKGNGTSAARTDYSFTDTNPAAGANYYRLRQIDFDGTEDFSKVVELNINKNTIAANSALASVYPTVASTEVKVNFALTNANVTVLDASGRQVAQFANAGRELVIPVSNLQRGVYFVTVTDGAQRQTQRFVKQ
ncbi:T9SS C-terminal target domain-containing protein [Pontibacter oryzae]|uniref:T9SS C-terminal target domain-containing protein n=2 Tax=Pontibacter oryzae TaxID=2304593 RepID=A0A399S091_9BACT|nr:T9SS C-terminal target domain-containing protein [Pontibacter oryzae]